MADMTEPARHGFKPNRINWVGTWPEAHVNRFQGDRWSDVSVPKLLGGGPFASERTAAGYLSHADTVGRGLVPFWGLSIRDWVRRANAELPNRQVRIETIPEERLPRER